MSRVVEFESVFQLLGEVALFVISGDNHGNRELTFGAMNRSGADPAHESQQAGISQIGIEEHQSAQPEDNLCRQSQAHKAKSQLATSVSTSVGAVRSRLCRSRAFSGTSVLPVSDSYSRRRQTAKPTR